MNKQRELSQQSSNRKNQITGYSVKMAIVAYFIYEAFYILVDFKKFEPVIYILGISLLILFVPQFLCWKKEYFWAKLVLSVNLTLTVFGITYFYFGSKPGAHFFFMLFSLLPFFIWSNDRFYFRYFFFIFNLICFILIETTQKPPVFYISFPDQLIEIYRLVTILVVFVVVALILIEFNFQVQKNEHFLEDQSVKLKKMYEELQVQTEMLEEANNTKNKFFSIISHDLRNPMSSILSLSTLLHNNYGNYDENKRRNMIRGINHDINQTYELLENLLAWSRIQTRSLISRPVRLNINDIIISTESLLKNTMVKKEITFEKDISEENYVFADEYMVTTVIRNLISNAIKFTPRNGLIKISIKNKEKDVVISIADTGVGIEHDRIQKLFDENQENQSSPGTENEYGTGLGLILCKEFMTKNKGEIWVESQPQNGTCFYVSFKKEEN